MPTTSPFGSADARDRLQTRDDATDRALAKIFRVLAHEGRLALYRRLATAGRDGVDAREIANQADAAVLVAVGLATHERCGRTLRYRLNLGALVRFRAALSPPEPVDDRVH